MLKGFYRVIEQQSTEKGFRNVVELNKEHPIYKAHFPGNPITPGVCISHICQELIAGYYHTPLRILSAKNIKFLNVLNPEEHPRVEFIAECEQTEELIKAMITVSDAGTLFAKISVLYVLVKE